MWPFAFVPTMRPLVALAALLLAFPSLAGCLGGDGSEEAVTRARAEVNTNLGGLEGTVVDDAVSPILGANVTLVETGETVLSKEDGSFAMSLVRPGTYTVAASAPGFVSAQLPVQVGAGRVATLDFVLAHLASQEAYSQVLELVGFFECGVEVGWNVSGVPEPAGNFFLGVAVCAFPNELVGGNTTNDRFLHEFRLDAPIDTVVYEMVWAPAAQTSEWMTTRMEVLGFANDAIGTLFRTQGPSPIRFELNRTVWATMEEEFRAACDEGDDAYCGFDFWTVGWDLQTRVFPAWQCASESGGGCVAAQQEFTHYVSAFYNAPAPSGYSALS